MVNLWPHGWRYIKSNKSSQHPKRPTFARHIPYHQQLTADRTQSIWFPSEQHYVQDSFQGFILADSFLYATIRIWRYD